MCVSLILQHRPVHPQTSFAFVRINAAVTSEPEHLNKQHVSGLFEVRAQTLWLESLSTHHRLNGTVRLQAIDIRHILDLLYDLSGLCQLPMRVTHNAFTILNQHVYIIDGKSCMLFQHKVPLYPRHSANGLFRRSAFAAGSCLAEPQVFPSLYLLFFSVFRKGILSFFILGCLVVYSLSRRIKQTHCFWCGTQLNSPRRKAGRKEDSGDLDRPRRSLWCRRCGTALCPTPARIPIKSGWKLTTKGKTPLLFSNVYGPCSQPE